MTKKFNQVLRWMTSILLAMGVLASFIYLTASLLTETPGFGFHLATGMIGSAALVTFASMIIYARTQKVNKWGLSKGKLVPLDTDKTMFHPPVYKNGGTVPAELWLGLSKYNELMFWRNNEERIVEATNATLFSQRKKKPSAFSMFFYSSYIANPETLEKFEVEENNGKTLLPYQVYATADKTSFVPGNNDPNKFKTLFANEINKNVVTKNFNPNRLTAVWAIFTVALFSLALLFAPLGEISSIPMYVVGLALITGGIALNGMREEKLRVLNEEATRIVLDGLAFQRYFKNSKPTGEYSLEGEDKEGLFLPWSIAFYNENHWEKVFAFTNDEGYVINGIQFELSRLALERQAKIQALATSFNLMSRKISDTKYRFTVSRKY